MAFPRAISYFINMRKLTYAVALVVVILCWHLATAHNITDPLFTIERSKNRNIVHYDARLVSETELAADPIDAYWIMENGQRQDLTWLEKRYGYGIRLGERPKDGGIEISLASFGRKMFLQRVDGKYKVIVFINGQRSILERIYVECTSGVLGIPKVVYAEFYGRTLADGASAVERIKGNASPSA